MPDWTGPVWFTLNNAPRRFHVPNEEDGACEIAQIPHWVLLRVLRCSETGTTVTMQYGDEEETCMVNWAEYPPQGSCTSVIEALIVANTVHEEDAGSHKVGSYRRVYGGSRSRTREELAAPWKAWSVYDQPMEPAVNWALSSNIVVMQVASPLTNDPWDIYEASLMLMGCDGGA